MSRREDIDRALATVQAEVDQVEVCVVVPSCLCLLFRLLHWVPRLTPSRPSHARLSAASSSESCSASWLQKTGPPRADGERSPLPSSNAGLVKGVEKVGDISSEDIDGALLPSSPSLRETSVLTGCPPSVLARPPVMFQTNVIGLIHLTQTIVKGMRARQSGHIINLGSVAGREAYAGGAIYCATKRAFLLVLRQPAGPSPALVCPALTASSTPFPAHRRRPLVLDVADEGARRHARQGVGGPARHGRNRLLGHALPGRQGRGRQGLQRRPAPCALLRRPCSLARARA